MKSLRTVLKHSLNVHQHSNTFSVYSSLITCTICLYFKRNITTDLCQLEMETFRALEMVTTE